MTTLQKSCCEPNNQNAEEQSSVFLIPPNFAFSYFFGFIKFLKFLNNITHLYRIITGIIAEKHIQIYELLLRPSMQSQMRFGYNNNAGDSRVVAKLVKTACDNPKTGAFYHGERFSLYDTFMGEKFLLPLAVIEIRQNMQTLGHPILGLCPTLKNF